VSQRINLRSVVPRQPDLLERNGFSVRKRCRIWTLMSSRPLICDAFVPHIFDRHLVPGRIGGNAVSSGTERSMTRCDIVDASACHKREAVPAVTALPKSIFFRG
jgi:hypothetical protein